MYKKIKNCIALIIVLCLIIGINKSTIYAENIETNNNTINEAITAINKTINDYLNINKKEPGETIYKQNTFHPYDDDFFGNKANVNPIYKVMVSPYDEKRKNKMALTFDSAYINDYTYILLDILDAFDVKATFFMTAEWASRNPSHVAEISRRGHEIGNHTYQHPDLNKCDNERVAREIMTMHNFIKEFLNIDMCLFRFPYGSFSERTIDILKVHGYYPIQWTFDSIDWKEEGADKLLKRFKNTNEIQEGSIVLFHNGAKYTCEVLPEILTMIQNKGLKCVKVSDLIYKHNFVIVSGNQYPVPDENGNFNYD